MEGRKVMLWESGSFGALQVTHLNQDLTLDRGIFLSLYPGNRSCLADP